MSWFRRKQKKFSFHCLKKSIKNEIMNINHEILLINRTRIYYYTLVIYMQSFAVQHTPVQK